jgi:glutathione S-transferase
LPKAFNNSPGRREVERLTGNRWVPVLVTDDGETVQGSCEIMDWARAHPAVASSAAT